MASITYYVSIALFVFVALGVLIRFVMLALSVRWIRLEKRLIAGKSIELPKVSLLIPAFNEQDTIVESVTHAINASYPDLEVVVVNDGSHDDTLSLLVESFGLSRIDQPGTEESIPTQPIRGVWTSDEIPNLIVVDKRNGGKADALNCGINMSTADYVLALDADTALTPNTIAYLIRPMIEDETVIATSGSVRILADNNRNTILSDLQKAEFVNSISLFRTGWNVFNANLIVSGALGLFDKAVLKQVNGYHNMAIGEDMELIVRIHRTMLEKQTPYKILQLALPTCFTKAVPTIGEMVRQRKRWQKGLLSSLRLNIKLFFNPAYGKVGLMAMPFYLLFEILGPFLEVIGLFTYGVVIAFGGETFSFWGMDAVFDAYTPLWVWLAGLLFAVFNDWLSISIDKLLLRGMSGRDYRRLLMASAAGPFFYHFIQLYCKIKGTMEYFSTIQTKIVWDTKR